MMTRRLQFLVIHCGDRGHLSARVSVSFVSLDRPLITPTPIYVKL
ncbi:unnamed protein product (plasmid) [Mycetohabitans rhizoxinica HKI 454]|uniref:Uncharacterized protein n=1 Tax=Mycetohabitans rhizoxinica (strain DSM 19002 / CIP 109453 / HKI 454) TaxID=882378 RepID=E5ATN8_MYCRK|nr:unnamed protein product [Mycetohabitans rhizoxinica HKI 454]